MALQHSREIDNQSCTFFENMFDSTFYTWTAITEYNRNEDVQLQYQGLDTSFTYSNSAFTCDEKFVMRWVNSPSACVELEIENQANKKQTGWFSDENSISNSILYVFPEDNTNTPRRLDNPILSREELEKIEVLLIKKEDIKQYLKDNNITDEVIENAKEKAYNNSINYNGRGYTHIANIKVNYLGYKDEKAYNLQFPIEILRKIACMRKIMRKK